MMRIVLFPLNQKGMKAQMRNMAVQPLMQEVQTKYKDNPEKLQKEMMKLYKETGSNPFSSCLPVLAQAPFFFALFRVLNGIAEDVPRGAFADYPALFDSLSNSTVFGAPLAASFATASRPMVGSSRNRISGRCSREAAISHRIL